MTGAKEIRRLPYDDQAVEAIAETLAADAKTAAFSMPGRQAYQLLVAGANERPSALVTLWPALRRVDVIAGPATVVFTEIAGVTLVEEIEVMFRRQSGELLVVARGGKVIVRA